MSGAGQKWKNFRNDISYKWERQKLKHPGSSTCMKWIKICLISLLVMILITLILAYVVYPILFQHWLAIQRPIIFQNKNVPSDPQFDKPADYGYKGVTNFYMQNNDTQNPDDKLKIGAWWVPQETYIASSKTMDNILGENAYPVVLYNHGGEATRIATVPYIYGTLRKFFHVVAIDYRDYGDSTPYDLTEEGVVEDVVNTYKTIRPKTNKPIYLWGHAMGGAISAHAIKWMNENKEETPAGLVLESTFTTMEDETYEYIFGPWMNWMPWYDVCVTQAIHDNGYIFNTTDYIQSVQCPIMMLHAKDDKVVPYKFAETNWDVANYTRSPDWGKLFYHSFAARNGYGHIGLLQDSDIPHQIEEFMEECSQWISRNSDKAYRKFT